MNKALQSFHGGSLERNYILIEIVNIIFRNWGARDSGGSTSPDYLVNADPGINYNCLFVSKIIQLSVA